MLSRKGALLRCREVVVLAGCGSEAAEESVDHGAGVKQVFERAQGHRRRCREGLCRQGQIGPRGRDQRFTAVRQDEEEQRLTFAMQGPQNAERLAFERMASTDNRDSLGKVLMMGSVSYVPSKLFYNRHIWAEDLQAKNRVVTYLGSSCGAEGLGLV